MLLTLALLTALPFGEVPSSPVAGAADCLVATGTPGQFVHSDARGTELLQAGLAGFSRVGTLPVIARDQCVAAAGNRAGAGVIAFPGGAAHALTSSTGVAAYVRDAGGALSGEVTIAPPASKIANVTTAESAAVDALVAWTDESGGRYRIRAARRSPGGAFSAPVDVGSTAKSPSLQAGIADGGEMVLAWSASRRAQAAIGTAAFGPVRELGVARSAPRLAVAPDGRALLATYTGSEVRVAERAPGGGFGAPVTLARQSDLFGIQPAVAVGAGGPAVVAWYSRGTNAAMAATRAATGAFGAPVTLSPPSPTLAKLVDPLAVQLFSLVGGDEDPDYLTEGTGQDPTGPSLQAGLTPDGGASLTWTDLHERRGESWVAAETASLPLGGGHLSRQVLGTALRRVSSLTPAELADGTPAVAWSDNGGDEEGGRLHLAARGATPAADPPAPAIRITPPTQHLLRADTVLRFSIRCSASCDVSAGILGRPDAEAEASRSGAGRVTLEFLPGNRSIAPAERGPVRFYVNYGAPGTQHPLTKTFSVALARARERSGVRVTHLTATRHGTTIDVRFAIDRPLGAREGLAVVGGVTNRRDSRLVSYRTAANTRRRSFHVTLKHASAAKYVAVLTVGPTFQFDRTTTRVR